MISLTPVGRSQWGLFCQIFVTANWYYRYRPPKQEAVSCLDGHLTGFSLVNHVNSIKNKPKPGKNTITFDQEKLRKWRCFSLFCGNIVQILTLPNGKKNVSLACNHGNYNLLSIWTWVLWSFYTLASLKFVKSHVKWNHPFDKLISS